MGEGDSRGEPLLAAGAGTVKTPTPHQALKPAVAVAIQAETRYDEAVELRNVGAPQDSAGGADDSEAEDAVCRRNIRMMFAFQLLSAVAWSTSMGPVFDKYLYYLGDGHAKGPQLVPQHARNSLVGMAESISGISSLVLAIPVGLLVDRNPARRSYLLRFSSAFGIAAAVTMIAAVLTDWELLIYLSLILLGAFSELSSSASEAIFADSIPKGKRSGLFTTKAILSTVGVACGPAISATMLVCIGNEWAPRDMKMVVIVGSLFMPAGCAALFFFQDPPAALRQGAAGEQGGSECREQQASAPEPAAPLRRRLGPFRPWQVPYIIATSDFITAIGAGMTVKFFNLFFTEDQGFKPTDICILQTAYPLVIAVFMKCTQALSKPLGRPQASLTFFSLNVLCLVMLSAVRPLPILIAVYLLRGGFANSSYPLDRSILMDFTPSSQRGRWNAVQSLTSMTWSGSAFIGGVLSDSHDYRYTFLITATVYFVACIVYAPLLGLVPRKESQAAEEPMAGGGVAAREVPLLASGQEAPAPQPP